MSVSDQRFIEVSKRLNEISDGEWKIVIKKCKDHIRLKLNQKCATGAHSEKNLGMKAFDHYFGTAIEKIYDGVWDWKFEKFSILEQLIRMINSMISEVVRKYRVHHDRGDEHYPKEVFEICYEDVESSFYGLSDPDEVEPLEAGESHYDKMLESVTNAIDGDDELESYFLCVMDGMNASEIGEKMDWSIKKVYKTTEKLQREVRSYIKTGSNGK